MTREHYAPGVVPDWALAAQRFSPLTHTDPQRRRPMAVRRTVSASRLRVLRVRWLAVGCVAGWVPLALVWGAVRVFGGAP